MALIDILRKGVKIADKVTKSAQSNVTYYRYTGTDGFGNESFASPATLKAVVDWKQKQVRTLDGVLSVSRASVMFIDIDALKLATNNAGIDDHDKIILPDGTTGPILDMAGFIDPGTAIPLATEVFLG